MLYAAFPLSEGVRTQLHDAWQALKERSPEATRFIDRPAATLHMTFVYLGEVDDQAFPQVMRLLEEQASPGVLPCRTFELLGFELFVTSKCTYAVASARPTEETSWTEHMRLLRAKLRQQAPMVGDRPWAPHVSVATLDERDPQKNNQPLYGYLPRLPWTLDRLEIYRKAPDGVQRHLLASLPLK